MSDDKPRGEAKAEAKATVPDVSAPVDDVEAQQQDASAASATADHSVIEEGWSPHSAIDPDPEDDTDSAEVDAKTLAAFRPRVLRFNRITAVLDTAILLIWFGALYLYAARPDRATGHVYAGAVMLPVELRVVALFWVIPPAVMSLLWCIKMLSRNGDRSATRCCFRVQHNEDALDNYVWWSSWYGENGFWHSFRSRRNPARHVVNALVEPMLYLHCAAEMGNADLSAITLLVFASQVCVWGPFALEYPRPDRSPSAILVGQKPARHARGSQTRLVVSILMVLALLARGAIFVGLISTAEEWAARSGAICLLVSGLAGMPTAWEHLARSTSFTHYFIYGVQFRLLESFQRCIFMVLHLAYQTP